MVSNRLDQLDTSHYKVPFGYTKQYPEWQIPTIVPWGPILITFCIHDRNVQESRSILSNDITAFH